AVSSRGPDIEGREVTVVTGLSLGRACLLMYRPGAGSGGGNSSAERGADTRGSSSTEVGSGLVSCGSAREIFACLRAGVRVILGMVCAGLGELKVPVTSLLAIFQTATTNPVSPVCAAAMLPPRARVAARRKVRRLVRPPEAGAGSLIWNADPSSGTSV